MGIEEIDESKSREFLRDYADQLFRGLHNHALSTSGLEIYLGADESINIEDYPYDIFIKGKYYGDPTTPKHVKGYKTTLNLYVAAEDNLGDKCLIFQIPINLTMKDSRFLTTGDIMWDKKIFNPYEFSNQNPPHYFMEYDIRNNIYVPRVDFISKTVLDDEPSYLIYSQKKTIHARIPTDAFVTNRFKFDDDIIQEILEMIHYTKCHFKYAKLKKVLME